MTTRQWRRLIQAAVATDGRTAPLVASAGPNAWQLSSGLAAFKAAVIQNAVPLSTVVVGVYFLVKGSEIVYVGQSVNVLGRLTQHLNRLDFDRACWVCVPRAKLRAVESLFIYLFRPRGNTLNKMTGARKLSKEEAQQVADMFGSVHIGEAARKAIERASIRPSDSGLYVWGVTP